ncbi:MAG TPA: hypothetical protein VM871_11690, partial [Flavisolibacter sp.]|nr:hypothetical protein [Flavisolibacter sp.]
MAAHWRCACMFPLYARIDPHLITESLNTSALTAIELGVPSINSSPPTNVQIQPLQFLKHTILPA